MNKYRQITRHMLNRLSPNEFFILKILSETLAQLKRRLCNHFVQQFSLYLSNNLAYENMRKRYVCYLTAERTVQKKIFSWRLKSDQRPSKIFFIKTNNFILFLSQWSISLCKMAAVSCWDRKVHFVLTLKFNRTMLAKYNFASSLHILHGLYINLETPLCKQMYGKK